MEMLSLGYEDTPFNSLFGELEGDLLLQENGVKATPCPQNEGAGDGTLFPELDQLDDNPFADWLTEKVDLSLLDLQDGVGFLPNNEFSGETATSPANSEDDELQELAVSPADLELLNSLVVDDEVPPQPVSPGEATAPHLLALSPTSSASVSRSGSPVAVLPIPPTDVLPLTPAATLLGSLVQQSKGQFELSSPVILSETASLSPAYSPSLPSPSPSEVEKEMISSQCEAPKKSKSKMRTSATRFKSVDKTSRKRDQNKLAATRYREKKKVESENLQAVHSDLIEKNKSLKEEVDSLSREIEYMKELMVDVYKAKGIII